MRPSTLNVLGCCCVGHFNRFPEFLTFGIVFLFVELIDLVLLHVPLIVLCCTWRPSCCRNDAVLLLVEQCINLLDVHHCILFTRV